MRVAKQALRERLLANRRELDAAGVVEAAIGLRDVLLAVPQVAHARCVAAYVSVGREPGTGPLIEALSDAGVPVLLPIWCPDGDLDWAHYRGPRSLVPAPRGLLEPAGPPLGRSAVTEADVVILPGLAADRHGVRLGRGGGSYDRVLARNLSGALTCVLLHDGELLDMPIPREAHDVPVAAAATPSGFHHLR